MKHRMNAVLALLVAMPLLLPAQTRPALGTLHAAVTDPDGVSIAGAGILVSAAASPFSGTTDARGDFTVQLAAGTYVVQVAKPLWMTYQQTVAMRAGEVTETVWHLGKASGFCVVPGNPCTDGPVSLTPIPGASSLQALPRIEGVSHLAVYGQDRAKSQTFYVHDLGATEAEDPEQADATRFFFNPLQYVEVMPMPAEKAAGSRLVHVAFNTSDAEALRRSLAGRGVAVPAEVTAGRDGSRSFSVLDPEGNRIVFVQPPAHPPAVRPNALGTHILHVGFMVDDLARERSFFVDVLGFRPYWHGGGADGNAWTSLQVPDGSDWVELMKVQGPIRDGMAAGTSQRTAGVLDHFSLGIANAEAAVTMLAGQGRLPSGSSDPKLGQDGKWQVNLYDPDGTRAELMEYQPVVPPCCSAFLLPSPVPPASPGAPR